MGTKQKDNFRYLLDAALWSSVGDILMDVFFTIVITNVVASP